MRHIVHNMSTIVHIHDVCVSEYRSETPHALIMGFWSLTLMV